jgi:ribonuclease VapC
MIVDASVMIAVLLREPGWEDLLDQLESAPRLGLGAPTLLETTMVLVSRLREDPTPLLEKFLDRLSIEVISFDDAHCRVASQAFLRFGKGRHPAALNFGDCMSYATARLAQRPLLFVGDDFTKTDLT